MRSSPSCQRGAFASFSRLSKLSKLSILLLAAIQSTTAFYLPGVAPTNYQADEKVELHVNRLTPSQSESDPQLQSALSFGYYNPQFHFCQPEGGRQAVGPESLGAVLFGDRIQTSPFELRMLKNETCKRLCDAVTIPAVDADFINGKIRKNYALDWLVDGLPAGQEYQMEEGGEIFYSRGFNLGQVRNGEVFLNNHYDIVIDYHDQGNSQYRVVGVLVHASSRKDSKNIGSDQADCGSGRVPLSLPLGGDSTVTWTYSVYWLPSKVAWVTRWDPYLHVDDPKIHWFSLVNSAVIVVFLVGTVSAILMRALKRDFARYNRLEAFNLDDFSTAAADADDSVQEDSGWKLVHGDAFRPPRHPLLLSIFLGNGAQLFLMTAVTLVFALFGFLSPSNRGSLGTAMIISYTLLGFVGGYVAARVYKTFGGEAWKRNMVLTPTVLPAVVFATFFLLNLFLWAKRSSGAVPFTTMLVLVGIWFLISFPLSIAGSWMGFKQPAWPTPVRTNQIPRQIPPSAQYLQPIPSALLVGALPFFAIFVELYFIMNSLWFDKIYYMFGFLFLCYALMILTCASVTVMFVYYLLCSEDYRWQWRAFINAGAGAIFVFAFALIYWMLRIRFAGLVSVVLYVGYTSLLSFLFFILTGTIGFFCSWMFVQRIYSSIRVD